MPRSENGLRPPPPPPRQSSLTSFFAAAAAAKKPPKPKQTKTQKRARGGTPIENNSSGHPHRAVPVAVASLLLLEEEQQDNSDADNDDDDDRVTLQDLLVMVGGGPRAARQNKRRRRHPPPTTAAAAAGVGVATATAATRTTEPRRSANAAANRRRRRRKRHQSEAASAPSLSSSSSLFAHQVRTANGSGSSSSAGAGGAAAVKQPHQRPQQRGTHDHRKKNGSDKNHTVHSKEDATSMMAEEIAAAAAAPMLDPTAGGTTTATADHSGSRAVSRAPDQQQKQRQQQQPQSGGEGGGGGSVAAAAASSSLEWARTLAASALQSSETAASDKREEESSCCAPSKSKTSAAAAAAAEFQGERHNDVRNSSHLQQHSQQQPQPQPQQQQQQRRFHMSASRNLAHHLLHRSIVGGAGRRRRRLAGARSTATQRIRRQQQQQPKNWNAASWVQCSHSNAAAAATTTARVTAAAWDATGEFLAVAHHFPDGAAVAVFDWHAVAAADLEGRRRRQRGGGERPNRNNHRSNTTAAAVVVVEPLLKIPLLRRGAPVQVLEWNPHDPREIVLGLRASHGLYSFDLEAVHGWQQQLLQPHGNLPATTTTATATATPPCRELRCHEPGARGYLPGLASSAAATINQDSCVCFLQGGAYVALSAGTAVFCWKLGGGADGNNNWSPWFPGVVSLHWKFQYRDSITTMRVLSPETLIVGSSTGRLAILNWKRLQRTSFSLKAVPTLVEDWVSFQQHPAAAAADRQFLTPSQPRAMSVQHLRVVKERVGIPGRLDELRLVWLTGSGWVLSSKIEVPAASQEGDGGSGKTEKAQATKTSMIRRKPNCTLHFATNPIKCFSDSGEEISLSKPAWSVPTNRVPACSTESALVWERVEDNVVQRLANRDQRVLGTNPQIEVIRSGKPSLCWLDMDDIVQSSRKASDGVWKPSLPFSVPLARRAGPPTCTAVHPDHEWVVVGTSKNGFYLLNARSKPKGKPQPALDEKENS